MKKLDLKGLRNGAILECADGVYRILIDGYSYSTENGNYIRHKDDGKFIGSNDGIDRSVVAVMEYIDSEKEPNGMCQVIKFLLGMPAEFPAVTVWQAISPEKLKAMEENEKLANQIAEMQQKMASNQRIINK